MALLAGRTGGTLLRVGRPAARGMWSRSSRRRPEVGFGAGGYALKNDGCRVSRRRRALDPLGSDYKGWWRDGRTSSAGAPNDRAARVVQALSRAARGRRSCSRMTTPSGRAQILLPEMRSDRAVRISDRDLVQRVARWCRARLRASRRRSASRRSDARPRRSLCADRRGGGWRRRPAADQGVTRHASAESDAPVIAFTAPAQNTSA